MEERAPIEAAWRAAAHLRRRPLMAFLCLHQALLPRGEAAEGEAVAAAGPGVLRRRCLPPYLRAEETLTRALAAAVLLGEWHGAAGRGAGVRAGATAQQCVLLAREALWPFFYHYSVASSAAPVVAAPTLEYFYERSGLAAAAWACGPLRLRLRPAAVKPEGGGAPAEVTEVTLAPETEAAPTPAGLLVRCLLLCAAVERQQHYARRALHTLARARAWVAELFSPEAIAAAAEAMARAALRRCHPPCVDAAARARVWDRAAEVAVRAGRRERAACEALLAAEEGRAAWAIHQHGAERVHRSTVPGRAHCGDARQSRHDLTDAAHSLRAAAGRVSAAQLRQRLRDSADPLAASEAEAARLLHPGMLAPAAAAPGTPQLEALCAALEYWHRMSALAEGSAPPARDGGSRRGLGELALLDALAAVGDYAALSLPSPAKKPELGVKRERPAGDDDGSCGAACADGDADTEGTAAAAAGAERAHWVPLGVREALRLFLHFMAVVRCPLAEEGDAESGEPGTADPAGDPRMAVAEEALRRLLDRVDREMLSATGNDSAASAVSPSPSCPDADAAAAAAAALPSLSADPFADPACGSSSTASVSSPSAPLVALGGDCAAASMSLVHLLIQIKSAALQRMSCFCLSQLSLSAAVRHTRALHNFAKVFFRYTRPLHAPLHLQLACVAMCVSARGAECSADGGGGPGSGDYLRGFYDLLEADYAAAAVTARAGDAGGCHTPLLLEAAVVHDVGFPLYHLHCAQRYQQREAAWGLPPSPSSVVLTAALQALALLQAAAADGARGALTLRLDAAGGRCWPEARATTATQRSRCRAAVDAALAQLPPSLREAPPGDGWADGDGGGGPAGVSAAAACAAHMAVGLAALEEHRDAWAARKHLRRAAALARRHAGPASPLLAGALLLLAQRRSQLDGGDSDGGDARAGEEPQLNNHTDERQEALRVALRCSGVVLFHLGAVDCLPAPGGEPPSVSAEHGAAAAACRRARMTWEAEMSRLFASAPQSGGGGGGADEIRAGRHSSHDGEEAAGEESGRSVCGDLLSSLLFLPGTAAYDRYIGSS